MATYVIGDVQGCYKSFRALLKRIAFTARRDRLWLVGDVVNRGPRSLKMLRFLVEHDASVVAVLGNHDIHLLGRAEGVRRAGGNDTLERVLAAPDRAALLAWLRSRPFLHRDAETGHVMVHAGLLPSWTIAEAEARARALSATLRSADAAVLLGDRPAGDDRPDLAEQQRDLAVLTRLRMLGPDGAPAWSHKGPPEAAPRGQVPWYAAPERQWRSEATVLFGHWAALGHRTLAHGRVVALDSGCVWGGPLTAYRLDDGSVFQQANED